MGLNRLLKVCVVLFVLFYCLSPVRAELPTAQQIAGKMSVGWNLGNALECPFGETGWGSAYTTQTLIDSVKAAGFNTVRLPVAWFCHSDTITGAIDPAWMARVKTIVDYCIKDSMYVIINIHWDNGWLENRINAVNQNKVNVRQKAYWTQIATYFKDYDEHLLFAGANEPDAYDSIGMAVLLSYHQTFINTVRATGGNNSSRTLIIQGPSTDVDATCKLMNTMPKDNIANRLMVEVHYYSPYQFCLMGKDAVWGKMFYYWGKGNHSKTDISRNATKDEEDELDKKFENLKMKFVERGIPVLIGEFGAFRKKLPTSSEQALHDTSINYYYRYVVKTALDKGLIPVCWDVPGLMFNRQTGKQIDKAVINAIMQGKKDAVRYKY